MMRGVIKEGESRGVRISKLVRTRGRTSTSENRPNLAYIRRRIVRVVSVVLEGVVPCDTSKLLESCTVYLKPIC